MHVCLVDGNFALRSLGDIPVENLLAGVRVVRCVLDTVGLEARSAGAGGDEETT